MDTNEWLKLALAIFGGAGGLFGSQWLWRFLMRKSDNATAVRKQELEIEANSKKEKEINYKTKIAKLEASEKRLKEQVAELTLQLGQNKIELVRIATSMKLIVAMLRHVAKDNKEMSAIVEEIENISKND